MIASVCRNRRPVAYLALVAVSAFAHDPGLSGVEIHVEAGTVSAYVMFTKHDADLLGPAELLAITMDGHPLTPTSRRVETDNRDVVHIHLAYPVVTGTQLRVRSLVFAVLPRSHRQYISVLQDAVKLGDRMLDAGQTDFEVTLTAAPVKALTFSSFLKLGLAHIFTGYDHLTFLFGLLIVGGSLRSAVKIITSFTIAHSISLALATFNLVSLSGKIVEPLIAASIMYVGIENLFRRDLNQRWMLTFAFGLVHGLGFASALRDLGVGANGGSVAVPLVSFNLGVELGQLSIAAVGLPLIWKLSKLPKFETVYAPACSVLVLMAGGWWLLARTLWR